MTVLEMEGMEQARVIVTSILASRSGAREYSLLFVGKFFVLTFCSHFENVRGSRTCGFQCRTLPI